MADVDYYGADYGIEESSRFVSAMRNFGLANCAGAVASLALTAGVAAWAVDMTMRDVSAVPVIAALEGPMREAPRDPGGTVAPFQGLALSDITSGGPAAPPPEEIVLAPSPAPLDAPALAERIAAKTEEDAIRQAEAEALAATPETAPVETVLAAVEIEEAPLAMEMDVDPVEDMTAEEVVAEEAPVLSLQDSIQQALAEAVQDEELSASATDPVAATAPAVASSVRPRARPSTAARLAFAPVTLPTEAPAQEAGTQVASLDATLPPARDADASLLAPGTRIVQLGAFDSESEARAAWDRLDARFGDYMHGKQRLVERAQSGGRDFWRLRVVGFENADASRRFCSELLARDATCIPLTHR